MAVFAQPPAETVSRLHDLSRFQMPGAKGIYADSALPGPRSGRPGTRQDRINTVYALLCKRNSGGRIADTQALTALVIDRYLSARLAFFDLVTGGGKCVVA
jgi:hypothetical protein